MTYSTPDLVSFALSFFVLGVCFACGLISFIDDRIK